MSDDSDEQLELDERPSRTKHITQCRAVNYTVDDNSDEDEEEHYRNVKVSASRKTRDSTGTSSRKLDSSLYDEPTEMEVIVDYSG